MLLHILGADIPHHNHTLLAFFDKEMARYFPQKIRFLVVAKTIEITAFPNLDIQVFPNKRALVKAVLGLTKAEPLTKFFFHGQYNGLLWLAILFGILPAKRCFWHIWGADLYENSNAFAFKLFYPLRRLAQKRLKTVFGTAGDLGYFSKINPKSDRLLLYFPTKLPANFPQSQRDQHTKNQKFTLLLGNSGDHANQHLFGLQNLKKLGEQMQIYIPMGYPENNQHYIEQVAQRANQLFGAENIQIWREKMPFNEYLHRLLACDFGYFPFERQQGIGTLCLFILFNIPFALSRKNPFCVDLIQQNVPFLYDDEMSWQRIAEVKGQLLQLDKSQIAFFPKGYHQLWLERLKLCT